MNKDELKVEMKNKISMALKDPILQQGFEIICKELEAEKKLNAEIKARFVKCNTCTDEMKSKCLMFSESLCQGERCEELVDLMGLISKSELEKENAELKERNAELKGMYAHSAREAGTYKQFLELKEKENAELETRCNELFLQTMQLTKAKEIIKTFLAIVNNDVEYVQNPQDCKDLWKELCENAEQFIKDSEVEK